MINLRTAEQKTTSLRSPEESYRASALSAVAIPFKQTEAYKQIKDNLYRIVVQDPLVIILRRNDDFRLKVISFLIVGRGRATSRLSGAH
jgi:hypothetical protein